MRNVSLARRASILILKCAFLASGLLSIWLICGAIETPELWWLYAMAAFGAFCGACLMLGSVLEAEDRLEAEVPKRVPVPKIERHCTRHTVR